MAVEEEDEPTVTSRKSSWAAHRKSIMLLNEKMKALDALKAAQAAKEAAEAANEEEKKAEAEKEAKKMEKERKEKERILLLHGDACHAEVRKNTAVRQALARRNEEREKLQRYYNTMAEVRMKQQDALKYGGSHNAEKLSSRLRATRLSKELPEEAA